MQLEAYRYRLPLAAPLPLRGRSLTHREGLLLRLNDAQGLAGWGEAAPLPTFSRETLDEAVQSTERLRIALAQWPAVHEDEAWATWLDARELPASVRFGIELAAANLQAAQRDTPLPHVLAPNPHDVVRVNALLTGGDHLDRQARRLSRAGCRTVKLKVGRRPVSDDVDRVRAAARALGPSVALRLDANRAWSWDEACSFAEGLQGLAVEYVEEPLRRPADLPRFAHEHPQLPLALDETTRERGPAILESIDAVCAIVLKPTLLGGISAVARWARAARERGTRVVLSTSFESGIGMLGLAALAAAFGDGTTAHGLGAFDRLASDVLSPRPSWPGAHIDVAALFDEPRAPDAARMHRVV